MKSILFISLLSMTGAFAAADDFKRFECIYGGYQQIWYSIESVYDLENDTVAEGEVVQGFAGWTGRKGDTVNYAICSTMTGTSDPNRVIISTSTYRGRWFNPVRDCNVTGKNVVLLNTQRKELARGQATSISLPWTGQFQSLKLTTYIPKTDEVSDPPADADQACGRLRR
jgi:hypothetical protein